MEIRISNAKLMRFLPAHIRRNKALPANLKRLLAAFLCHHQANLSKAVETGRIAVSVDELCTTAHISKTTFYLLKAELEMLGLVTLVVKGESRDTGKKGLASEYFINFDKLMETIEVPTAEQMIEYIKKKQNEGPSETPSCTAILSSAPLSSAPLSSAMLSSAMLSSTDSIIDNTIIDNHLLQEDDFNNHLPTVTNDDNIIIENINKTTSVEELLKVLRDISIDGYDRNLELRLHEVIDNLSYLDNENKQYSKDLIHTKLTTQHSVIEEPSWLDNLDSILTD